MCNYTTLKSGIQGYVIRCHNCDHIQVAFGTTIISLSKDEFYQFISVVDERYRMHNLHPFRDHKTVQLPTAARSVAIALSVNELKELLSLLTEGRNKLEYEELFVFNEN